MRLGRTAESIFTLYGSNDVFLRKEVGKYAPNPLPKMAVNRQFQTKTPKYRNRNISKTINPIKNTFEEQAETDNFTSWVV